jgi:pyrrolidone-carboxylate peptidase
MKEGTAKQEEESSTNINAKESPSPETPNKEEAQEPQPQPPLISFILTGFGPFGGVADNPTTTLIHKLQKQQQIIKSDPLTDASLQEWNVNVLTCQLIDTSISGVKKANTEIQTTLLDAIRNSHNHKNQPQPHQKQNQHVVIVHLGVNAKGTSIQLETTAFNEASFRIPDNEGNQPKKQCIDEELPLTTRLGTSLPIKRIQTLLEREGYTNDIVKLSGDAGRFICNYTYWTTLNDIEKGLYKSINAQDEGLEDNEKEQEENKMKGVDGCEVHVHALFVHVPAFDKISQDVQLKFVCHLLQSIHLCLMNPKKKKTKKKKTRKEE